MYWNQVKAAKVAGCSGWIVTLDVLKLLNEYLNGLNSNIRCIEITNGINISNKHTVE